jgi:hypothetical protein
MPHPLSAFRSALAWAVAAAVLAGAAAAPAGAAGLDLVGTPGTAVHINGLDMGKLPLAGPLDLQPGTYVVEGKLRGCLDFATTVRLDDESGLVQVHLRMMPLSRRTAWTSSVLYAGLGQFYTGHDARGWLYAVAETGGLLTAIAGELQRTNYRKDYLVLMDSYYETINADEAAYYRRQAAKAYSDMEDMEKLRDTGLLVAAAAVGISVLDALITFPSLEAGPGAGPAAVGRIDDAPGAPLQGLAGAHAAFKLSF